MKVEFLRALEDKTWDTVIADVPSEVIKDNHGFLPSVEWLARLTEWAENTLLRPSDKPVPVLYGIYHIDMTVEVPAKVTAT